MKKIEIFIPGTPVAKQRVKSRMGGKGKIISTTPKKTVQYEQHVRNCIMEQITESLPIWEKGVPLKLTADFMFLRPESVRKGKNRREYHIVKPDCDNLLKSIADAGNTLLYHDDSQIMIVEMSKTYTEDPREEGVLFDIEEIK